MSTDFKAVDRASYDSYARAWDAHSEKLSGLYAPTLLRMANLAQGHRALEVCCGTGVVSRAAAGVVGPSGSVVGTDITPGMIAVAAESAAAHGLSNVVFRVMDCEALELEDSAFDVGLAMCPHFSDHRRALAELRRVVRPGGWVAIGVGGGTRRPDGPRPTPLALQIIDDVVRRYQPEDPGGHPPNFAGPDPIEGLPAVLAEAGFGETTSAMESRSTHFASPEEAWEIWSMTASPVRHRLTQLSTAQREAARGEFLAAFAPLANAETLTRLTRVVFGAGRKPG